MCVQPITKLVIHKNSNLPAGFLIRIFTLSQTASQLHVHCATLSNDGPHNITTQLNILIVRLNCVTPKWDSYSGVHHLVFTLGEMVHHMSLSNTLHACYCGYNHCIFMLILNHIISSIMVHDRSRGYCQPLKSLFKFNF